MNRSNVSTLFRGIIVLLLTGVAAACGRNDAEGEAAVAGVEVSEVRLGRTVGADRRVMAETDQFGSRDSIYASVATQGSANNAVLTARWLFQDGQVVDESRETISPTGPANTAFHIYNPGGWPTGNYRVEIRINDRVAETREFTVR
jgi:hypothetical protein